MLSDELIAELLPVILASGSAVVAEMLSATVIASFDDGV